MYLLHLEHVGQYMLPFSAELRDGEPVSDQLLRAVRKAILTGQLRPGDTFPSVRTLSQELRMSPTTAHKVVARLKETGFLAVRPGIGMVVSTSPLPPRAERLALLKPACVALLREAAAIDRGPADAMEALRQAAGMPGSQTGPTSPTGPTSLTGPTSPTGSMDPTAPAYPGALPGPGSPAEPAAPMGPAYPPAPTDQATPANPPAPDAPLMAPDAGPYAPPNAPPSQPPGGTDA